MPAYEIRISPFAPPPEARIARALKADGVYSAELLELAVRWGDDLDRAWRECERLEIVYPLASLAGASRISIARAERELVIAARELLPRDLGWEDVDREIAAELLDGATAPDLDLTRLEELRWRTNDRLAARAPGRYRQHLMRACSLVAELGMRRDSPAAGFSAAAYLVVEHVLGALVDEDGGADLFSARVDVAAFCGRELERARALMEIA